MGATKRIIVEVPGDLLRRARRHTRQDDSATVRKGLELIAAGDVYERLLQMQGKVKFSIDWEKLREDDR